MLCGKPTPEDDLSTSEKPGLVTDMASLPDHVGAHLGYTEWREMEQDRVNQFADVTDDHNYIHVDLEKAKASPFGGTIAHGYLTLALAAPIRHAAAQGHRRQGRAQLRAGQGPLPRAAAGGRQVARRRSRSSRSTRCRAACRSSCVATIEVKGSEKPAMVAECLVRLLG